MRDPIKFKKKCHEEFRKFDYEDQVICVKSGRQFFKIGKVIDIFMGSKKRPKTGTKYGVEFRDNTIRIFTAECLQRPETVLAQINLLLGEIDDLQKV